MCFGCYERYGSPRIATDATRHAARLIKKADPFGPLHIVVEDDNLEDCHLEFCRSAVFTKGSEVDRACFSALIELSLDERVSAMAIAQEYIPAWPSEAWPRSAG